ncbi:MAG: MFS transporter [Pseudomonadota bacterium]
MSEGGFFAAGPRARSVRFSAYGHFYSHFAMTAYATIAVALPQAFPEWSYAEILELATPAVIVYGLGAPVAGWLADRWSRIGMIAVFLLGVGCAGIACGLAPGPTSLAVAFAFLGLFGSIYHPVGFAWLSSVSDRPGYAFAINGLFGTGAIALAPLATGAMIDMADWRTASIVPGVAALICGVALWRAWAGGRLVESGGAAAATAPTERAETSRVFAVLAVSIVAGGMIVQGLPFVLPKLFDDRFADAAAEIGATLGFGPATMIGAAVFLVYAIGAMGNFLGGWLADKVSLKWAYVSVWALNTSLLGLLALAFGFSTFFVAAAIAFLNTAALPVENVLLSRWTPQAWRGRMFGWKFILAFGVSGLSVPAAAYVYDRYGDFGALFVAGAAIGLMATTIALLLPADREPVAPEPAAGPVT